MVHVLQSDEIQSELLNFNCVTQSCAKYRDIPACNITAPCNITHEDSETKQEKINEFTWVRNKNPSGLALFGAKASIGSLGEKAGVSRSETVPKFALAAIRHERA